MQPIESQLKFQNYQVEKMLFSLNDNNTCEAGQPVELMPEFSREIRKIQESQYELLLKIVIERTKEQEALPFSLEVTVKGSFLLEGIENAERSMQINATAILFPYLRTTVSLLMSLANIEPLLLPAINIVRMFDEQEKLPQKETV